MARSQDGGVFPAVRPARPGTYCEAVGRVGGFLGDESGRFEAWLWPVRILRDLRLFCVPSRARVIQPQALSPTWLEYRPESLLLAYSLPQTTVHQHLYAVDEVGALVCTVQVDTSEAVLFGLEFEADLVPMWPASLGGRYTLWDDERGAYVLTEGRKKVAALVGMPGAARLSELVAHEPPGAPLRLALECEAGVGRTASFLIVLSLDGLDEAKSRFDRAREWLEGQGGATTVAQQDRDRVRLAQVSGPLGRELEAAAHALQRGIAHNPQLGEALLAGLGPAGSSYRPGFGWFFGGDAAINSLGLLPFGLSELTRKSLDFFARFQRDDGRIAHEISQAAGWVDWFGEYPYAFIHADTTPYFILCAGDYLRWTGDLDFVRGMWSSLRKAYEYCRNLDTDDDGLVENSAAGLGALELGSLLANIHVDIYLASVWTAALREFAWMARLLGDEGLASGASELLAKARESLNRIFWGERNDRYEFALLTNGGLLDEPTAWSAMPLALDLAERPLEGTIELLASSDLCADWGARMVAASSEHYDPVGYNNGAVWPFLTGLVAWALYRAHHPEAGRFLLWALGQLHFDFAYGLAHEVFSGDFYRPLPASVPHQLFSSSTFAAAAWRGMLGLEISVPDGSLVLRPHLPPGNCQFLLRDVPWGEERFAVAYAKGSRRRRISLSGVPEGVKRVVFEPAIPLGAEVEAVRLNDRDVAVRATAHVRDQHVRVETSSARAGMLTLDLQWRGGIEPELARIPPRVGDRSRNLRLVNYRLRGEVLWLLLEGPAGAERELYLHTPWEPRGGEGWSVSKAGERRWLLRLRFPGAEGMGFVRKELEIPLRRTGSE